LICIKRLLWLLTSLLNGFYVHATCEGDSTIHHYVKHHPLAELMVGEEDTRTVSSGQKCHAAPALMQV
jgi:hypothetical protein